MRVNYNYIKIVVLILLVGFLFAFSNERNNVRKVSSPQVKFLSQDNLFITHETVSKLLIQNQQDVTDKPKEIIDLNQLETALNSNPMIKKAQLFMSVDGVLSAEIEQKRPIARVSTNASFYIDDEGSFMHLSTNYSARVPLVTGVVNKNNLSNIFKIASAVDADGFLKKHVVEIHQNADATIDLRIRKSDFKVQLGHLKHLEKKINNFKAFYQKAMKDKTLNSYSIVNLRFDNQVICTKK
ncbi:MAG: hypothetical protein AAF901_06295 [Bacteroidota bacterium]